MRWCLEPNTDAKLQANKFPYVAGMEAAATLMKYPELKKVTVDKNFDYEMMANGEQKKNCLVGRVRGTKYIGASVAGRSEVIGTLEILSEPLFLPSVFFWPIAGILIFLTLCCLPIGVFYKESIAEHDYVETETAKVTPS